MIEVDGSRGEGGGQILRTAISMSAVLRKDVRITGIRAGRPKPGLAAQHVSAVSAVAEMCDAVVEGGHVGSTAVIFRPGTLAGGEFEFDTGTAGSTPLVLQACILPAARSRSPVTLRLRGGTDTKWAPPVDFMRLVHLPVIKRMGVSCEVEVVRRGFYPEGGGELVARIDTCGSIKGVDLGSRGRLEMVTGVAYAQNLPEHVVSRMAHAAVKGMVGSGPVRIEPDLRSGTSTGAGMVLAAQYEHSVLGASALGERGVRSETLGESCAADLVETMRSEATVDEHMLDQVLPYMALAEDGSVILAEDVTSHAETNMWVVEKFLGRRFDTRRKDGLFEVRTV